MSMEKPDINKMFSVEKNRAAEVGKVLFVVKGAMRSALETNYVSIEQRNEVRDAIENSISGDQTAERQELLHSAREAASLAVKKLKISEEQKHSIISAFLKKLDLNLRHPPLFAE